MSRSKTVAITTERAARLFKLAKFLDGAPRGREWLQKRLGLDLRGFYRDLRLLRQLGIEVIIEEERYRLALPWNQVCGKLPFPIDGLTFDEVLSLSRGKTSSHKKLQTILGRFAPGE